MTDSLEALTKVGLYAGLLTLIGSATAVWLARATDSYSDSLALSRRLWSVATAAASVLIVFLFLRLLAHTWITFGSEGPLLENLGTMALRSRWSGGWRLQLVAAFIVQGLVTWAARRGRSGHAALPWLAIAALAWTFSTMGHSASSAVMGTTATVHMLAGGLWLGTLTALVAVGHEGRVWARFSGVALTGAAVVSMSGLVLASTYLGSWRDLLYSAYGRTFSLKMLFLMAILGCGFNNWRQVRRTAGPEVRPPTARLEVALAALLVVATAFLTEIAHP